MLDPMITPCCDQKQLRYFFQRVDNVGYATFFSKDDYSMSQFLDWMIMSNPNSVVTLAVPTLGDNTIEKIRHLLSLSYYMYFLKKNAPVINHLNLIVGDNTEIPEDILKHKLVTVAKTDFTFNYLLLHKLYTEQDVNMNADNDLESQKGYLNELVTKAQELGSVLECEGKAKPIMYEKLEGAWIDYMLSRDLSTSTKGTYYTLHGIVSQQRLTEECTSSVTCIKGKYAYDEVMHTLNSILRVKKVKLEM